jgi:hypothetical protein
MNLDPVTAAIVALALLASDPEFELWVSRAFGSNTG